MAFELPAASQENMCAALKRLGCIAVGKERQEWVSCRNCGLRYHSACSGLGKKRGEFVCCLGLLAKEQIERDINAIRHHFPDIARQVPSSLFPIPLSLAINISLLKLNFSNILTFSSRLLIIHFAISKTHISLQY